MEKKLSETIIEYWISLILVSNLLQRLFRKSLMIRCTVARCTKNTSHTKVSLISIIADALFLKAKLYIPNYCFLGMIFFIYLLKGTEINFLLIQRVHICVDTFNLYWPESEEMKRRKKLDKHLRRVHVFRLWLCGSKMRVKSEAKPNCIFM